MTNKVVYNLKHFFHNKENIKRKKFELNFILSFIFFDFSDTFL